MPLWVHSNPGEYLVVGRRGRLRNRGLAGSAFLWPGSSSACVASTKQEAAFAMTQETSDGIPLRFKGVVVYRVVDPVAAATYFDFSSRNGHAAICDMIAHVCLGELRAAVAHMTMQDCIEQRKTTLTTAVEAPLRELAEGDGSGGWGIELDVVQVAQVYIVDQDLRRQLEAETRDRIRATSELSRIRTQEEVHLAEVSSTRSLQQEDLVTSREQNEIAREKLRLKRTLEEEGIAAEGPVRLLRIQNDETVARAEIESRRSLQQEELETERRANEANRERARLNQELETDRIEADSPVRLLRTEKRREEAAAEKMLRELEREVEMIRVERDLLETRARQELKLEILPVEQVTEVASYMADMLKGANVTLYGEDAGPLAGLEPIVDFLTKKVRHAVDANGGGQRGSTAR